MLALSDVTLSLDVGERLAVVGENGAGKSTLMNVLAGLYTPSDGEVWVDGAPVRLRSTRDALARGIAMVHQHFTLAPSLTVAENVVLGAEPTQGMSVDLAAANASVGDACARYGFALDPSAPVRTLSVAAQQKVEIVKALHRRARVLILDEPTAVLAPLEVEGLWRTVRALSESGVAVVLIAHKLREVLEVATRIAVMRRGKLVAETFADRASPEQLAGWMLGESASAPPMVERSPSPSGEAVLEVQALCAPPRLRGVTMRVGAGEVVGVAGVDGNGQRELAEVLTGLRDVASGEVRLAGAELPLGNPGLARARGVAHVPEDRSRAGLVFELSVEENLALGRADRPPFGRRGWIDLKGRRARARSLIAGYDVRPPLPAMATQALSGGNQQKVVLARELDGAPRLIVAVQPTRGLDFSAVATVHRKLRESRNAGAAVLLISLDLDELFALSDRLYVMCAGEVRAEFTAPFTARDVGQAMLGGAAS